MKRFVILTAALLLPLAAGAASYTVSLTGNAGTGFATLMVDGDTLEYSIITSGLDPAPTGASLESTFSSIDLDADFGGMGSAMGSISGNDVALFVADPTSFILEVSNGTERLTGAVEGGMAASMDLYFPVTAAAAGANDTFFATDVRIVNRGAAAVDVTLAYYPQGAGGNSAPAESYEMSVAANQQAVIDDLVGTAFGLSNSVGAVKLTASGAVDGFARIYNDQTSVGAGTFGQLSRAMSMDDALSAGMVPFLSNMSAASGEGYRANIGWFNPNAGAVNVSFHAWDAAGDQLYTESMTVNGMAQEQMAVGNLFSSIGEYGDFYLSFTADAPIFVYGSVVDNVNGDAIFVSAIAD